MAKIEKRTMPSHGLEIRAGKGGERKIVGYAAVFDSFSQDLGGFREKIAPGAFRNALKRSDAVALYNHNPDKILGRQSANTLTLREDENGLWMELVPPNNTYARDLMNSIERRDVSQQSFGFTVKRDSWGNVDSGGLAERTLDEIDIIYDVSPCVQPAYPDTSVALRSLKQQQTGGDPAIHRSDDKMRQPHEIYADYKSDPDTYAEELHRSFVVHRPGAPDPRRVGPDAVERFMDLSISAPIKPSPGSGVRITEDERDKQKFRSDSDFYQAVIRAGMPGGNTDARLSTRAATGMSEGINADGGFLVPTDIASGIITNVWKSSGILSRVHRMTIKGNSIKVNGVDETSRADGSRAGGVRGYWIAEAGEKQKSKPTFRQIELNLNKVVVLAYATDELLDDATALAPFLGEAAKAELEFKLVDAIINGTGVGQPLGILNSGCVVSVAKESGQAAATIEYTNIVKMWARLMASSRPNAVWLINQDVETQLHTLSMAVGTGGVPTYLPASGAAGTPYSTLFGRPVIPVEQCATLGTTGDIMLCDFSKYLLAERGGVQGDVSIHCRFVYDETCFRWLMRVAGQPLLASAIDPFSGSSSVSHFIKLDTRA